MKAFLPLLPQLDNSVQLRTAYVVVRTKVDKAKFTRKLQPKHWGQEIAWAGL